MRCLFGLFPAVFVAASMMSAPPPSSTPKNAKPASAANAKPSPAASVSAPAARPQFRPSVLRSGAESLANKIDVAALQKKGQKSGAVMFCALVSKTGETTASWTYRGLEGTTALDEELNRCLETTSFTIPLYEHQPVSVLLQGTVIYSAEAKPHIRILLNQDPGEIGRANDFISPQPVIGANSAFEGLHLIEGVGMPVPMTAVVDLVVKVDDNGALKDLRMLNEEPPLLGFGRSAMANLQGARFIPAFRDGGPTDCEIIYPVCYKPKADQPAENEPPMDPLKPEG